ncbi:MAG: trypsin-like peptidase domain-containing protein [Pirellulaceae bacterium]|jgi:serine protease Do|nr:trypsin-like peptidase domain-containing protein [Pirellulaceae bacterium]MDP6717205.1 trypsin-like peptidase domain-containing protein [Pirellulaceae bacterium]
MFNRLWILNHAVTVVCLTTFAIAMPVSADDMPTAIDHAKSLSRAFRSAAKTVTPSVVTIIAKQKINNGDGRQPDLRSLLNDPSLRRLFPDGQIPRLPRGGDAPDSPEFPGFNAHVGSGVVIDNAGVVLTNNHVVAGADEVIVRLKDGSEITATEIRTDPLSDVAIVRFKPESKITAATLGDSSSLEIGDWVIAIGSPFELEATVSAGIISAKGRGIVRIPRGRLIQTDAAINPGNSGGPLVNLDGRIVGINTAIATNSGGYQGVGFAIPVNQAKWISDELLAHGKVRRAWLGIEIGELDAEAARRLELRARSGVRVVNVFRDSPADKGGLEDDDVIIKFGEVAVRSPGDLQAAVEQQPIGSARKMIVVRGGDNVTLDVTLAALPDPANRPRPQTNDDR